MNRPAEARTNYSKALALRPRFIDAQVGLAQLEGKTEARRLLKEAAEWGPGGRIAFARFLLRNGERIKARNQVDAALREAPNHKRARALLEVLR